MLDKRKKVGLALGGGSARGFAHIGILDVFEKEGIPMDYICGCSMGALVGSIYCTGTDLAMLEKLICQVREKDFFDVTLPRKGLIKGAQFREFIKILTHNKSFDEMQIPFSCVACDISAGKTVTFSKGKVYDAVRASISIPGAFEPHFIDGVMYVDGGVLDIVPIPQTRDMGADVVIAVNVSPAPHRQPVKNRLFDVMMRANDLVGHEYKLIKLKEADLLIEPEVANYNPYSNARTAEIIQAGRVAAQEAIPAIRELLGIAPPGDVPLLQEGEATSAGGIA
ncbi:patatin-like phospholipase family protein [Eubacteriales bacterium OttesenSCG-928-M02]|nr:patatin-like phospholipase family protein [Eubacteriales bacterium OttesenSCG-928-M02]